MFRTEWLSRNSEEQLARRLQDLVRDAESESEMLIRQFDENEIDYADFIRRYIDVRRRYAERKIKLIKIEEDLAHAGTIRRANAH